MRSWHCLHKREQQHVTQISPLEIPLLSVTLAGTQIFLSSVSPHSPSLLTLGSRREKISSIQVESVKRMPPVITTPRY